MSGSTDVVTTARWEQGLHTTVDNSIKSGVIYSSDQVHDRWAPFRCACEHGTTREEANCGGLPSSHPPNHARDNLQLGTLFPWPCRRTLQLSSLRAVVRPAAASGPCQMHSTSATRLNVLPSPHNAAHAHNGILHDSPPPLLTPHCATPLSPSRPAVGGRAAHGQPHRKPVPHPATSQSQS